MILDHAEELRRDGQTDLQRKYRTRKGNTMLCLRLRISERRRNGKSHWTNLRRWTGARVLHALRARIRERQPRVREELNWAEVFWRNEVNAALRASEERAARRKRFRVVSPPPQTEAGEK